MAINTITISNLKLLTSPDALYYITDVNKEGVFYLDTDTVSPNDNGIIIVTNAGKRFKRIYEGPINAQWFGAGSGAVNDDVAINAAINYVVNSYANTIAVSKITSTVIYIPPGTYNLHAPIVIPPLIATVGSASSYSITLTGAGIGTTTLQKIDNTVYSAGLTRPRPETDRAATISDNMAVDAAIIIDHQGTYTTYPTIGITPDFAYHVTIANLSFSSTGTTNSMYAIFSPRTSALQISNVNAYNFRNGFFTYDTWLSTFNFVAFTTTTNNPAAPDFALITPIYIPNSSSPYVGFNYHDDGSGLGTGTTNTYNNCYSVKYNYSFLLYGLSYSTLTSCAADGTLGTPYFFNSCHQIGLVGCGSENTSLNTGVSGLPSAVVFVEGSDGISINSYKAFQIYPDTVSNNSAAIFISNSSTVTINGGLFPDFMSPSTTTYNLLLQYSSLLSSNGLILPTNGNTYISYASGSSWTNNTPTGNYFQFIQLSSTQITALLNLQPGVTVYNTTTSKLQTWNGTIWNNLW